MDVERTFTVDQPVEKVIDYLADFGHAEEWDPGTKSCTPITTDQIAVGKQWRNVSEIKGRQTELTYTLERRERDRLTFVGKNKGATSTDDLTFWHDGGRTTVTYHANIEFHGIAKLAALFLQSEFERLGDETRTNLVSTLNAL